MIFYMLINVKKTWFNMLTQESFPGFGWARRHFHRGHGLPMFTPIATVQKVLGGIGIDDPTCAFSRAIKNGSSFVACAKRAFSSVVFAINMAFMIHFYV